MPLVFVHGVGTRSGGVYDKWVRARNLLFHGEILEPLELGSPDEILNPYWGEFGAKFRWNHAYWQLGGEERLGPADEQLVAILQDAGIELAGPADGLIRRAAEHDLLQTINAVWSASIEEAATVEERDDLAVAGLEVLDYLDRQFPGLEGRISASALPWAQETDRDEEFLIRLLEEAEGGQTKESGGAEYLGKKDPSRQRFSALWQGLERIGRLPADLAAKPAGWLVHTLAQDSIEMLVGDVAWYFEQRGPKQNPGPINQEVINSLEAARSRNSKLIVVAHSMGGNIVYDVLSWYRPDIEVDLLVTVGSQVGYFEEIGLFRKQDREPLPHVKPPNVKRWINIADRSDLLGYSVSRIFPEVLDYAYDTGSGLLTAHSRYFEQLVFYRRLRRRVAASLAHEGADGT